MDATHQSEHVTAPELRAALIATLEQLAPRGGGRSVPCNLFCDGLIDLMADILTASQPTTAEEIERLVELFRSRLEAALPHRVN